MKIRQPSREIQAPHPYPQEGTQRVFLAGSIEMGGAIPWQAEVCVPLLRIPGLTILNPRRDDWDSGWTQSADDPRFREQVEWELQALADADVVGFYFHPGTRSPISLLELGLMAASGKPVVVACPEGFWRRGNVVVVCERFGLHLVEGCAQLVDGLRDALAGLRAPSA